MPEEAFDKQAGQGLPLQLDADAQSTDPTLPAFLAPPDDAPAYYGFPLAEDTLTEGWLYGAITAFEHPDGYDAGDGFVQAPDGSRAGIVWGPDEEDGFEDGFEVLPPDGKRWGVYAYRFARPVKTVEDMTFNFRAILPDLKHKYAHISAKRQNEE